MGRGIGFGGMFTVSCYDKGGNLRWKDTTRNIVTAVGRRYANNAGLAASAQISTWYVGMMDGTPTVASGDTAGAHGGWTEFAGYDEATRVEYDALGSLDQVGNNASKASFAINVASDVGGAFVISDSGKGSTNGTLFSGASFTGGDKSTGASDTITVEYTVDVTSS